MVEGPPSAAEYSYDPKSMFVLSEAEQNVYDDLEPYQQEVYTIFRNSFVLSQGQANLQNRIIHLCRSFVSTKVNQEFNHEKIPSYLVTIFSPKGEHVVGGQQNSNKKLQKARLDTLDESWRFINSDIGEENAISLQTLEHFVQVDSDYLDSTLNKNRATGNDRKASFLREYVLTSQLDRAKGIALDQCFDYVLDDWREMIQPYLDFYKDVSKELKREDIEDLENWLLQKIVGLKGKILQTDGVPIPGDDDDRVIALKKAFGIPDVISSAADLPPGDLISRLYILIKGWEKAHPGISFFDY